MNFFFFSSRRRHTRSLRDWSSDVCSSDLVAARAGRQSPDRDGGKEVEHRDAEEGDVETRERQFLTADERVDFQDNTGKRNAERTGDLLEIGRASCRERVEGGAVTGTR